MAAGQPSSPRKHFCFPAPYGDLGEKREQLALQAHLSAALSLVLCDMAEI